MKKAALLLLLTLTLSSNLFPGKRALRQQAGQEAKRIKSELPNYIKDFAELMKQDPSINIVSKIHNASLKLYLDKEWYQNFIDVFLHVAVQLESLPSIRTLLEEGANPNSCAPENCLMPLHISKNPEIRKLLKKFKADSSQRHPSSHLLITYAKQGKLDEAGDLLKQNGWVNISEAAGRAPLHLAVLGNDKRMIDLLLSHGARLDLTYSDGIFSNVTVLHAAATAHQAKTIVQQLVSQGTCWDQALPAYQWVGKAPLLTELCINMVAEGKVKLTRSKINSFGEETQKNTLYAIWLSQQPRIDLMKNAYQKGNYGLRQAIMAALTTRHTFYIKKLLAAKLSENTIDEESEQSIELEHTPYEYARARKSNATLLLKKLSEVNSFQDFPEDMQKAIQATYENALMSDSSIAENL